MLSKSHTTLGFISLFTATCFGLIAIRAETCSRELIDQSNVVTDLMHIFVSLTDAPVSCSSHYQLKTALFLH